MILGKFIDAITFSAATWLFILWLIALSVAIFFIAKRFEKIMDEETKRGGEEFGERAIKRIQKAVTSLQFISVFLWIAIFAILMVVVIFRLQA